MTGSGRGPVIDNVDITQTLASCKKQPLKGNGRLERDFVPESGDCVRFYATDEKNLAY
jgi:hypothetical protein